MYVLKRMKRLIVMVAVAMGFCVRATADSFVRVLSTKLLGRDGQTLVMRGTNCGNWMVREPYMMNTSGSLDRQFKFDRMLAEVCGEERVAEFDSLWMDNNFCEEDMRFISELGMNTLRVPMHYKYFTLPIEREPVAGEQTWLSEGFERIDSMCEWADRWGVLLVLDMHACPGGQSSGDICDYDASKPSLWENEANRKKLVELWRKIAERYRERKCVAAYDLINETNWTLPDNNKLLWDTFKDIIKAIRQVDSNHIVILEGNSYSNDYTGLPSTKLDAKMMLQYHRYGVYNTKSQVQGMAEMAAKYRCPVFIGEFGENSNSWTAGCVRLYEEAMQFGGWACWPMKKSNINALLQVKRVASYDNAISSYQNGTPPSATTLWNACREWAEAQHISRCTVRKDYADALMRRPFTDECLPFVDAQTDDYIYAAHYDMGEPGRAYLDHDEATYQYNGEDYTSWQRGWTYRNDGVDLYANPSDAKSCGYYVGETRDGEWLQYTIQNPHEAAAWQLQMRYAIQSGSSTVRITVNDRAVTGSTRLSATGEYTTWSTKNWTGIVLPQGVLRVRIYIEKGGLNINYLRFFGMKQATEQQLQALEPDTTAGRNLLANGNCEYQGAWQTAALASINNARYTWGQTTEQPTQGSGPALGIASARSHALNTVLYQPVQVQAGHVYQADVAVRGNSGNGDFWIQAFMVTERPKDYADTGLDEANTIGQLNSWKDATLADFDGLMSARAKAGANHAAGTMRWKANSTGTVYFALKVGTQKSAFSFTFDSFTLTDLTAIETAIPRIPSTAGGTPRIFNLAGQRLQPPTRGIYIIGNKKVVK